MAAHARLGPSAAHRWMTCPGSVALEQTVPDRGSSFAAEGTAYHEMVADCLEFDMDPGRFLGRVYAIDGHEISVDEAMVRHAREVIARVEEFPGRTHIETRVDLSRWLPGQFGTLDVGISCPDEIVVLDHKYGAGVPVSPEENEQLLIYAGGFWDNIARHETDAQKVRIVIDQPRAAGGGGEWVVDLDYVLEFMERAGEAGEATYEEDAPRVPSAKGCRFCKAKLVCPEFARWNEELIGANFDDLDAEPEFPSILSMDPGRRAHIALHADLVRKYLDLIHARVLEDALAGRPTPGAKAVAGRRGPRKWRDEGEAEAFLIEQLGPAAFKRSLISPADADKLLPVESRKAAAENVVQSDPKPVLVSADSPKPAVKTTADKFDDIGNNGDDE